MLEELLDLIQVLDENSRWMLVDHRNHDLKSRGGPNGMTLECAIKKAEERDPNGSYRDGSVNLKNRFSIMLDDWKSSLKTP